MLNAQHLPFVLQRPGGLRAVLFAWIAAEIVVFAILVHNLGFGGTILLDLLTSVIGVVMLKRIGSDAARSLRRAMAGGEPPEGALLDGMLGALGAVLLILPGFVANLAGLALAAPSVRRWTTRTFGGAAPGSQARRPARADVIDLSPDDWKQVEPR